MKRGTTSSLFLKLFALISFIKSRDRIVFDLLTFLYILISFLMKKNLRCIHVLRTCNTLLIHVYSLSL